MTKCGDTVETALIKGTLPPGTQIFLAGPDGKPVIGEVVSPVSTYELDTPQGASAPTLQNGVPRHTEVTASNGALAGYREGSPRKRLKKFLVGCAIGAVLPYGSYRATIAHDDRPLGQSIIEDAQGSMKGARMMVNAAKVVIGSVF
ncbi:MAG: hypothetical protein WBP03_04180 [Candidatus Saccharimonadales bacterium]